MCESESKKRRMETDAHLFFIYFLFIFFGCAPLAELNGTEPGNWELDVCAYINCDMGTCSSDLLESWHSPAS